MKRFKTVGLSAVLALVAMVAIGAASASAAVQFEAETYPASVLAQSTAETNLGTDDFTAACSYTTAQATLAESDSELTTSSVTHGGCVAIGGTATVAMNGCNLSFDAGVETGPGQAEGSLTIGPSGCGPVKLVANTMCTATFPAQQASGSVTYQVVGSGSSSKLLIDISATGLEYTQSGPSCSKGTFHDGFYEASWEALGRTQAGEFNGLDLGVISGEPQLEASRYPMQINGEQGEAEADRHVFAFESGDVGCENATLSGELSAASSAFDLAPSYSGCSSNLIGAMTANMNGCDYAFDIDNAGPPYTGSVDLVCPPEKAVTIVRASGFNPCTVTLPAQTDLAAVSYSNDAGVVEAELNGSGIDYSQSGLLCPGGKGSFSNGTLTGLSILSGDGALVVSGEGP